MAIFKIGVMSDGFRLSPADGIRKAAEIGADGVQIYTVTGEMAPEALDSKKRADFRNLCAEQGLVISALCGDMGGGFRNPEENPKNIKLSKQIVDLAVDLGVAVVTTHIGVVPEDSSAPVYDVMLTACRDIADYAASRGVTFAIETGPEKAATLKAFLDKVDSKGLGVNLDPANLVMVVADDPVAAVHTLAPYIVHTHAKDGVQLEAGSSESVYHSDTSKAPPAKFKEVPLGEGDVDWDNYLKALEAIGYTGFLTIEREVGDDPSADIERAVLFLKEKMLH